MEEYLPLKSHPGYPLNKSLMCKMKLILVIKPFFFFGSLFQWSFLVCKPYCHLWLHPYLALLVIFPKSIARSTISIIAPFLPTFLSAKFPLLLFTSSFTTPLLLESLISLCFFSLEPSHYCCQTNLPWSISEFFSGLLVSVELYSLTWCSY